MKPNSISILIGNGIGMALDPEFFDLGKVVYREYEKLESKSVFKKFLSKYCWDRNELNKRIVESSLQSIEEVYNALITIKDYDNLWNKLSSESPEIAGIISEFPKFKVSIVNEISNSGSSVLANLSFNERLKTFMSGLTEFIHLPKDRIDYLFPPHIFTLNYDKLLYHSFYDAGFFDNENPVLCDGFLGETPINKEVLNSRLCRLTNFFSSEKTSCFLNLHGSALYERNADGSFYKKKHYDEECNDPLIVLTAPKYKDAVISGTPLLSAFWGAFEQVILRSRVIFLVGYSGRDLHIQQLIKSWMKEENDNKNSEQAKKIIVIEDAKHGKCCEKIENIKKELSTDKQNGMNIQIIPQKHANILDYNNWSEDLNSSPPN